MSRQSSIVTFTGKMSGISFYQKDGVHFARKANGPSKSKILNDPRFARTRENLSEFSGLTSTVSTFTRILSPVKRMRDNKVRGRLSKILRSITKGSPGIRGQRGVIISENRALLNGLALNTETLFATVFTVQPVVTHAADRSKATISIANLNANSSVNAPPQATHFRLVHHIGVVSDVAYDEKLTRFTPLDAVNNGLTGVTYSDYLPVKGSAPVTITLDASLDNTTPLSDKANVVQCIGIQFFEQSDTNYYLLGQAQSLKIINVF